MSARPTWKGHLQIGQVAIAIKVYPATAESEKLSFNQLHDACLTRVQHKKHCAACARDITHAEIVSGYEFEPGKYVVLLPEELDAVAPPSARVIDLTRFAHAGELAAHVAIDRSYYLAPDGPHAAQAFAVLRDGMTGAVGLGKLAIYGREYLVAVAPHGATLMLHTLHHAAEIRSLYDIEALGDLAELVPPAAEVRLARQLVEAMIGPLDLGAFTDAYRADVQKLIAAKIAGDEVVVPAPVTPPVTLNLRDALTQSLLAHQVAPVTTIKPPGKRRSWKARPSA